MSKQVMMKVSSELESMVLSGITVVSDIPMSTPPADLFSQHEYPHPHGLKLAANVDCGEIDNLVGQNFADALIPLEVYKGLPYGTRSQGPPQLSLLPEQHAVKHTIDQDTSPDPTQSSPPDETACKIARLELLDFV